MAHYINPNREETGRKKWTLPKINGRFGISFSFGTKEVFIGVALADVVLEQMIKRRVVKISKANTRTFGFEPFSQE